MGSTGIPADTAAHFNPGALPGFLVLAGTFIILVMYAWYLEHKD